MNKVGLLGGSFDPIHLGHIGIAMEAIRQLNLEEVWLVLAVDPNLKDDLQADFLSRSDMVELAIEQYPKLKLCTVEKNLSVPSYSINTVIRLKEMYPDNSFTFLIGSDQANQLDNWHRIDELREMVEFKVISRNGQEGDVKIENDAYPQSSTAVRNGRVEYLDPKVWQYIVKHELYLEKMVEYKLSAYRYEHTRGVIETALTLAKAHGLDRHKTYLAALFHDIAKELTEEEMKAYLTEKERQEPIGIWHAFVGAKLVRDNYQIKDEDIYEAIYCHTKGESEEPLALAVFCADKVEPGRKYDKDELFRLCIKDLNEGSKAIKAELERYYREKHNNDLF